MKHAHDVDINVKVDLPIQDMQDLVHTIGAAVIVTVGFYMATDTVRHIFKSLIK